MTRARKCLLLPLLTGTLAIAATVQANGGVSEEMLAGRRVLARNRDAVITVILTTKVGFSIGSYSDSGDSQSEITGVVIDPSGLTVVPLSALDPSKKMNQRFSRRTSIDSGGGDEMRFESELSDVKLLLPDESELPAEVVMRDHDLDLAFLRPADAPSRRFAALSLTVSGKAEALDRVIVLDRLGKVADRVVAVSLPRIQAVIERPRLSYLVDGQDSSALGDPVFNSDGTLLGLVVTRVISGGSRDSHYMFSGVTNADSLPIVIPAVEISEGARQALEVKRKAKKK